MFKLLLQVSLILCSWINGSLDHPFRKLHVITSVLTEVIIMVFMCIAGTTSVFYIICIEHFLIRNVLVFCIYDVTDFFCFFVYG